MRCFDSYSHCFRGKWSGSEKFDSKNEKGNKLD